MSRCWIALTSAPPAEAAAVASVTWPSSAKRSAGGGGDGFLAAWEARDEPLAGAVKIDLRAIDPSGAAAWASLVLAPRGAWLLFDDVAVSHALRAVLAGPPVDVVSTFVTGDDRFVGAFTAVHGDDPIRLTDDPFALGLVAGAAGRAQRRGGGGDLRHHDRVEHHQGQGAPTRTQHCAG